MASKIIVIIASADRAVVQTAMMYAHNTMKFGWLDDVKIIFFGPSEQLVAKDTKLAAEATKLASLGETIACKFISDKDGTSETLSGLGLKIEYVGPIIANLIKEGYVPMVW